MIKRVSLGGSGGRLSGPLIPELMRLLQGRDSPGVDPSRPESPGDSWSRSLLVFHCPEIRGKAVTAPGSNELYKRNRPDQHIGQADNRDEYREI